MDGLRKALSSNCENAAAAGADERRSEWRKITAGRTRRNKSFDLWQIRCVRRMATVTWMVASRTSVSCANETSQQTSAVCPMFNASNTVQRQQLLEWRFSSNCSFNRDLAIDLFPFIAPPCHHRRCNLSWWIYLRHNCWPSGGCCWQQFQRTFHYISAAAVNRHIQQGEWLHLIVKRHMNSFVSCT